MQYHFMTPNPDFNRVTFTDTNTYTLTISPLRCR